MSQPAPPSSPTADDIAAGQGLSALVLAQAAARAALTTQAIAIATKAAQSFSGWYDSAQITAWAAKLATQIESHQRVLAQSTDVYLARVLSQILGQRIRPVGRVDITGLRAGITHAGAYARAADVYRWQQARFDQVARTVSEAQVDAAGLPEGVKPWDLNDPIEAAVQRVASVADTDMQLADRAQSQKSLEAQDNVTGYRRVIHPERSKGGTCGLCIAASDRIYHVAELRAIHDLCECTTLPIVGSIDPGSGLNNLDLQTLYDNAGGSTGRADLKDTRYQINEHGELGPVLTDGTFRTPRQAKAATDRPRRVKTAEQRAEDMARIRSSLSDALPRAKQLAQSDPASWGDYLTKLEDRIRDLDSQLTAA